MDCEVRKKVVEDDRVNEASVLFLAISAIKLALVDKASSMPSRCCGGPKLKILKDKLGPKRGNWNDQISVLGSVLL
jgi:hypothetical protein